MLLVGDVLFKGGLVGVNSLHLVEADILDEDVSHAVMCSHAPCYPQLPMRHMPHVLIHPMCSHASCAPHAHRTRSFPALERLLP